MALLLGDEDGDGGHEGRDGAADVDVEDRRHVVPAEPRAKLGVASSSVGDDHVEATELPVCATHSVGHCCWIRDIERDGERLAAQRPSLRRDGIELRRPPRAEGQMSAAAGIFERQRATDAAGSAGNQNGAGMQARRAKHEAAQLTVLTSPRTTLCCTSIHPRKGATGFDGDDGLIAAYRGPQAHVKTRGTHNCER